MILALGAGGFIERFGGWRLCQFTLLAMSAAMLVATPGLLVLFAVSALLISPGPGVSTPAGSHILARHCPPRQAPLFFSIKQTSVPVGGLLAGMLLPFLALRFGWRGAFLATGILYVLLALLLQPFRSAFDSDRHAGRRAFLADARATMTMATTNPGLRHLVLAAVTFVGLQALFESFFVIYLVKGLDHSLTDAGTAFSMAQGVAIVTRILWGGIAGSLVPPRLVLAGLGLVMAVAAVAMALLAPGWSMGAVMAVAVVYTTTAFSWHGVLLAEVARLAPPGQVGATTGGVLVFMLGSATLYPFVFAAILASSGSYGAGFLIAAVPVLIAAIRLFWRVGTSPTD